MSEKPLNDELRERAEQVAAVVNEDVIDAAVVIVTHYKREWMLVAGMLAVDAMVSDGPDISEQEVRLMSVRERLRDRLKALLG